MTTANNTNYNAMHEQNAIIWEYFAKKLHFMLELFDLIMVKRKCSCSLIK